MYKKAWCTCKVVVLLNINLLTFCFSRCKLVGPVAWEGVARKTYYDTKKTAFVVFAILDCSQVCPKWKVGKLFPTPRPRISFRVRLSWEFSRLPQMENLLAGYSLISAHALFTATCTCFLARIEQLIRLIVVNGFLSDSVEINSCT